MPLLRMAIVAASLLSTATRLSSQGAPPRDLTAYAFARDSTFARPVNRSFIAFAIPEKDLLAESVAYDPASRAFFVGSTRHGRIVRRAPDGGITYVGDPVLDSLWMIIGIKIDSTRRILWANTTAGGNYTGMKQEDAGKAALVGFDVRTGRRLHRLTTADTGVHFFNDLVVQRDGSVLVTDMRANVIYRGMPGSARLERWHTLSDATFPNGIALSGDQRTVFVAHREGISAIDVASGRRHLLAPASGIDVLGIDGLYWHKGSLIAIQNGRRNRVQRFDIAPDGRSIPSSIIVEANHPMFMNPTTGVLVGNDFYYIANSQFSSFEASGTLFDRERLFETVILRVTLPTDS